MASGIVGRESELTVLAAFLEQVEAPRALAIEGEAGIGKTTVWQAALELARARGYRVLAASPAEAEQTFSYTVLGDVLEPVAEATLARLPAPQRRSLEQVLLRAGDEEQIDARVLGVAVRSIFRAAAEHGPVLVAIDDVQWTDAASVAVLGFALRRVGGQVVPLVALRRPHPPPLRLEARRLEIGPLSVGALHHLLVARLGTALQRPWLLKVHQVSGGNPFYALELARANPASRELVLPESLRQVTADRLRVLPRETQRALAVFALAGSPEPGSALAPAEDAGVVETIDGRLRWTHPLLAEGAVSLHSAAERRAFHREIAGRAVDLEQRARHLAQAAEGADEGVAAALAVAAGAAARRGVLEAAAELWELAGRLTPDTSGPAVHERLVEAAVAHVLTSNTDRGTRLLDEHVEQLPRGPLRERGTFFRAFMLVRTDVEESVDALELALGEIEDPITRYFAVRALTAFMLMTGDEPRAQAIHAAFLDEAEAAGDLDRVGLAVLLSAHQTAFSDRPAWALVERALAVERTPVPEMWFPARKALAFALLRDDRLDEARSAIEDVLRAADEVGEDLWRGTYLLLLAEIELSAGNLVLADSLVEEVVGHSEQAATPFMVGWALGLKAATTALLGEEEGARTAVARALELAAGSRAGRVAADAHLALGLLELSLGRPDEAAAAYRLIPPLGWQRSTRLAGGRAAADAVGALAAAGDLERAREIVATLPADARELSIAEAHLAAAAGKLERAIGLVGSARHARAAPARPRAAPARDAAAARTSPRGGTRGTARGAVRVRAARGAALGRPGCGRESAARRPHPERQHADRRRAARGGARRHGSLDQGGRRPARRLDPHGGGAPHQDVRQARRPLQERARGAPPQRAVIPAIGSAGGAPYRRLRSFDRQPDEGRTPMKRLIALAAGLAAGVAVTAATTASGHADRAGTTTIRVDATSTSFHQVGKGIGSVISFTDDLFQNGKQVGTDVVACVQTGPGNVQECYGTDTLPKGEIASMGPSDPAKHPRFPVAITGGTGAYRDARGWIDIDLISQTKSAYVYHVDGVAGG